MQHCTFGPRKTIHVKHSLSLNQSPLSVNAGQGHRDTYVFEEYAEDNYYAMLDYLSFHCSRKTQFNVNIDRQADRHTSLGYDTSFLNLIGLAFLASTFDFQQCGILISVDSDEPV